MRRLLAALGTICTIAAPAWGQQGSIWRPLADVTVGSVATQVAVANAARLALVCANASTTVAVRLGDATVSVTAGVQLQPKGTMTFTGSAALFAVAETGTAVMTCSEEIR